MTWALTRRGAMSVAEMWRTRKSSSEMANTHFSWLKARPLVARMMNNARRGFPCCSLDLLKIPSSSKKEKHILLCIPYALPVLKGRFLIYNLQIIKYFCRTKCAACRNIYSIFVLHTAFIWINCEITHCKDFLPHQEKHFSNAWKERKSAQ